MLGRERRFKPFLSIGFAVLTAIAGNVPKAPTKSIILVGYGISLGLWLLWLWDTNWVQGSSKPLIATLRFLLGAGITTGFITVAGIWSWPEKTVPYQVSIDCGAAGFPVVIGSDQLASVMAIIRNGAAISSVPSMPLPPDLSRAIGGNCTITNYGKEAVPNFEIDLEVKLYKASVGQKSFSAEPAPNKINPMTIQARRLLPGERFDLYVTNLCQDAWITVQPPRAIRVARAIIPAIYSTRNDSAEP